MDAREIRRLKSRLMQFLKMFDDCFARKDTREHLTTYVQGQLSDLQRNLIMRRYGSQGSVQTVAREYGRTPGAISQSLHRIRAALLKCIEHQMALFERG